MTRDFGKSLCMKKRRGMKRKIQLILESINQSINLIANFFSLEKKCQIQFQKKENMIHSKNKYILNKNNNVIDSLFLCVCVCLYKGKEYSLDRKTSYHHQYDWQMTTTTTTRS